MCFSDCYKLIEVDFSSTTLTSLALGIFSNCHSLLQVKLPHTITEFKENKNPDRVQIGDSIGFAKEMDKWEEEIKNITRPLSPLTYRQQAHLESRAAFYNCFKLKSIDISVTKVKSLPDFTFFNCSDLKNIKLPDDL